jgi:hypothetical protein
MVRRLSVTPLGSTYFVIVRGSGMPLSVRRGDQGDRWRMESIVRAFAAARDGKLSPVGT